MTADHATRRRNPHIKTELPGPKAKALIARDAAVVSPSYPRDYPFVMSHGKGAEVWDVDGNRFLDFAAGIAVCATGHSHPEVVAAITEAAKGFLHISSDYWHERQVRLGERIRDLKPMGDEPAMSFMCNSGTEAVEGALKLARYVTGRSRFIGFFGGFHGRTMGALSFTSSKYTQQSGFFPTMPGVTHVPYPNNFRPLLAGADQGKAVLDYIENVLFQHNVPASEVAGILIEPIQGEGGYVVPPDGFLQGLRALCDKHGILLIFDEVQSGDRTHGEDVRRAARRRRARHHDARQGPGQRHADRARGGEEEGDGEVEARRAREHVRRESRSAAPRRSRRSTSWSASTRRTPRRWAPTSWSGCASGRSGARRSARCAARAS